MSGGRARRIADKRRMKAKAVKVYGRMDVSNFGRTEKLALDPERHAKIADHMAVCSSWMCGNPRKYFAEPTMQERRFAEGWGGLS